MKPSLHQAALVAYGLLLLSLVGWFVAAFPIFRVPLAVAFLFYAACLWRWPWLWLVALPALLPLFDLAPLSGRFFFDEYDALVLLTAGLLALRKADAKPLAPLTRDFQWALALLAASYLVSTLIRLVPPTLITVDSFANYASPYNSIRVAKGIVWALLLFRPLRQATATYEDAKPLLALGFLIGLVGVGLVSVYERWLFIGVLNWTSEYRTTASFSSMHTGDGPIDAWLATAIPFLGLLFISRLWVRLLPLTIALGLLSAYTLFATSSRGPTIAVAIAYGVGLLALLATRTHRRRAAIALPLSLGLAIVGGLVALPILARSSIAQRFAQSSEDAGIRLHHWRYDLSLRDQTLFAQVFGMGVGSFPAIHQQRSFQEPRATRYRYFSNGTEHFLRLWTDLNLYIEQAVPVVQNFDYAFGAKVRTSEPHASFVVMLCEAWMLTSENCASENFHLRALPGRWQTLSKIIHTNQVGAGRIIAGIFFERPVKLTFFASNAPMTGVDIGEVSFKNLRGEELVRNGDFVHGADQWFWSEDDHWQWHTANLAVNILFDQGWLGLLAIGTLICVTVVRLSRQVIAGDPLSAVYLASITGFIVTGITVSTFDQPRLAFAFYLICFAALSRSSPPAGTLGIGIKPYVLAKAALPPGHDAAAS